jgi:hypothetical protein
MSLWGKIDSIANMPKFAKGVARPDNVVFEDNTEVYSGGFPGVADPSNRIGWYFKNTAAGNKVSWYLFDGVLIPTTLGATSFYAIITLDNLANKPFIMLYTLNQGAGDAAAWYRSREAYVIPAGVTTGTKYLIYKGTDPVNVHKDIPHIQLTIASGVSEGPRNPSEIIMTAGISSDSGASANTVQFVAETFGIVTSDNRNIEVNLRIKSAYNDAAGVQSPKGELSTIYLVDLEEVELAKEKGITGPGWWKYTTYTTSDGKVRHKAECLVPMNITRAISGDRDDSIVLPNGTIVIATHPASTSKATGQSVSFSVSASASDGTNCAYQWQQSTNGTTYTNIANARSSTYSFSATAGKNGYKYRVIVSAYGLESVTSNAATLTVT